MTVNFPFLLGGILLLWFPRPWMRLGPRLGGWRSRRSRPRWRDEPWNRQITGSLEIGFVAEFTKLRNYLDLFRAAAGGLAVVGGYHVLPALSASLDSGSPGAPTVRALQMGILLAGVLIQTVRVNRGHLSFFAPVFYLGGLSLCLAGHWAALFAFVLIWAVNPMLRTAQAFLSLYALLLGVFTFLFRGIAGGAPAVLAGLCFLPVLLSLPSRRRLGVLTRRPLHSEPGA